MTSLLFSPLFVFSLAAEVIGGSDRSDSISREPTTVFYNQLTDSYVGDWQKYGELFTRLQSSAIGDLFLAVLVILPVIFLLHYLIIGPIRISHDGDKVLYYTRPNRVMHIVAAISFTLLVLSGLIMLFGAVFGGGSFVRLARYLHIGGAVVFTANLLFMFYDWSKDMLPAAYDLQWMLKAGGYLSKEKKKVPAGKFNAGQKIWFWMASIGGAVMAFTGYFLWSFSAELDTIRIYSLIHSFLGAGLVGFFIIHVYMVLFAIKGSLDSMKTGFKPKEEVELLHSRYIE